jgi:hypothetical protein
MWMGGKAMTTDTYLPAIVKIRRMMLDGIKRTQTFIAVMQDFPETVDEAAVILCEQHARLRELEAELRGEGR